MGSPNAYYFGDFELKVKARVLMRGGKQVPLGSKAFEVLNCEPPLVDPIDGGIDAGQIR
ncbi:MAG: hypothetical protein JOZ83_13055 [Silvibacterium sp.]|nr:hypothetical protein [Silvibacterium sp.]